MSTKLNIDEQIENIDNAIEVQKWYVERADALKRLKENEDFKLVISDGYINVEADRIYEQLMMPQTTRAEDKEMYMSQLETIKNIIRYLGNDKYQGTVNILATNAKKLIDENQALKQELLMEKGGDNE